MSEDATQTNSLDQRAARVLQQLDDADDPDHGAVGDDDGEAVQNGSRASDKSAPSNDDGKPDDATDAIAPPVSWSGEEKETFRKLPREAQAAIARREGERERFVSQRVQQTAQRERSLEEQRRNYAQRLDSFIEQTATFDALNGPTDLGKLARENPAAFAERVATLQQRAQQIAAVQQERQRIADDSNRSYLVREFEQLGNKLPEFRDAAQRQRLLTELGDFLGESGFSQEEMGGIVDHRAYLIALDAMRYRKLIQAQKGAAAKRVVSASRTQRPGNASDHDDTSPRLQALRKAARTSGKLDDRAAYVLAALRDL
jgi:hypothetical protein